MLLEISLRLALLVIDASRRRRSNILVSRVMQSLSLRRIRLTLLRANTEIIGRRASKWKEERAALRYVLSNPFRSIRLSTSLRLIGTSSHSTYFLLSFF